MRATLSGCCAARCRRWRRAYADMDLLVFPSHTDTFGNVVLEALASGVPAVVTPDGGPKYIVRDGERVGSSRRTRGVCRGDCGAGAGDRIRLREMRAAAARAYAMGCNWDAVFSRGLCRI